MQNSRYKWFSDRADTMTPTTVTRNLRDLLEQIHPDFTWNDGSKPSDEELGDWWRCVWLLERTWRERWPESYAAYLRSSVGEDGNADPETFLR